MSVVTDIVAKLKKDAPIFGGRVSVARQIQAPEPEAYPESWVHRWFSERIGESTTTNIQTVNMAKEIVVMMAVRLDDNTGEDYAGNAETAVLQALCFDRTFLVGQNQMWLVYRRTEIADVKPNHMILRMIFDYTEYLRKT